MEFVNNPPSGQNILLAAQSQGNYDCPLAIADLIDNSITANAKKILIDFEYRTLEEGGTMVFVMDNGAGMNETELNVAMKAAARNPNDKRDSKDLGRFGWGLKSASFSQCKKLTVITKKKNQKIHGATWDLDDCDDFKMGVWSEKTLNLITDKIKINYLNQLKKIISGTCIIWENCNRLTDEFTLDQKGLNDIIDNLKLEVGKIFFRFLDRNYPLLYQMGHVEISLNGNKLEPFDPFYSKHTSHFVAFDKKSIFLPERLGGDEIIIQPHLLPHYEKVSLNEQEKMEGKEGLFKNQGFYIFRNNRLIISGTWFKLVRHTSGAKWLRISVDIPNTMDSLWNIKIDKSDAQLPAFLKKPFLNIIQISKKQSNKVANRSGYRQKKGSSENVWLRRIQTKGEIKYVLNRENLLIQQYLNGSKNQQKELKIDDLLVIIESMLPRQMIINDKDLLNDQSMDDDQNELRNLFENMKKLYIDEGDMTTEQFYNFMIQNEPFDKFQKIIKRWVFDG